MEKIDEAYYDKICGVLKGEPTIYQALFAKNYEEERLKFLNNKRENPIFAYNDFSLRRYGGALRRIEGLKDSLKKGKPSIVKKLYSDKLDELKLKIDMRYEIGKDSKRFHRLSSKLYSKPSPEEYKRSLIEFKKFNKKYKRIQKRFDSNVIKKVFNGILKDLGLEEWKAVILKQSHSITINAKHKNGPIIEIPETRRAGLLELEQLVHHEILTHLFRGISGQRSKLDLIGFFGTDNYIATEEGLAIFNEEWVLKKRKEKPTKFYFRGTIAIGAAMEGRNFRETNDYLCSIGFSKYNAWKHTYRVFRGVSDTSKKESHICTLDWVYRKGNKNIKNLVKKRGNSVVDKLYIGKIGIKHLNIMKKLGIVKPALKRQYINIEKYL